MPNENKTVSFLKNSLGGFPESVRQTIESKVDDSIQKAFEFLNIPTREEVSRLQSRIDDLLNRCEALTKDNQG